MAAYGYYTPPKPKKQPAGFEGGSLAYAAAGKKATLRNPFGLAGATSGLAGAPGFQRLNPQSGRVAAPQPAAPRHVAPVADVPQHPAVQAPVAPPAAPNVYDINTDPALQQITALIGMNDEQAQAEALKQKKNLLLDYGDPELAKAVLGEGDPTVAAAGQNPFSQRMQLGQQRDRNVHNLTEGLNQANLLYGGYRITQEEQAARDYQNAIAQAAAGVNSGLGQIGGNLAGALAQSRRDQAGALQDAYGRHALDPGVDPEAAGINDLGDPLASDPYGGGLSSAEDYLTALARAAATRRAVAV